MESRIRIQMMSFDLNKFTLDGLDGNWRDFLSTRYFGSDTVMVWSGFYPEGGLDIAFVLTRANSSDYDEVIGF
ncbi:hypothetical protein Y032_0029g1853 [Ancylostoma ceylanicum]|uniref:Uncharacterized protein n=1 Tax=Ancylostoma ceylanicum TaxID=53326 RepID=A0A016URC3_9BILA|nr:hypothetical protein Y032_0029g1853 [Ancylostoma ceylanicum]